MPLTWKDRIKHAVSAGGTGALTLGAASSGYQAFAAGDNAKLFAYVIEDGTAWETGYGTYTHSGTSFARTSRTASSTGSALTVSTSAFVFVDIVSSIAEGMDLAAQSVAPGGRLTLESGVPVSTTDQTAKTTIYYTPYTHNIVTLWDGNRWQPVVFAETSLALGTITNGKNYDVFGYLSAGALALEMLVWTSDTARATAVTLQDGRYCKSGDKTRLLLGTFRTTSTTTTEDSAGGSTSQAGGKRFVWNMYNRVRRALQVIDTTNSWSYTTDTWRVADGATAPANCVEILQGLAEDSVTAQTHCTVGLSNNSARAAKSGVGISASTPTGLVAGGYCFTGVLNCYVSGLYRGIPGVGYYYLAWLEKGADGNSTFDGDDGGDGRQGGLQAEVMA